MHGIIIELLDDEEAEVKNLAIEAFLDNIDKFTQQNIEENLTEIMTNLIAEMNESDPPNDSVVLNKLDEVIKHNSVLVKLFWNQTWWDRQSDEFHNKVLYNSSYVISVIGSQQFFEQFYDKYLTLMKWEETKNEGDESPKCLITADVHNVVKNLGAIDCFVNDFEKNITYLMNDKYLPAKGKLLENLHVIVETLHVENVTEEMWELGLEKKINNFKISFMKNFLKMEDNLKNNWRFLNLWIDWAFRIIQNMHEKDPPWAGQIDGTSGMLKKFIPIIISHLKKGWKATRDLWILFIWKLMPINSTYTFRKDVYDLATNLPYATWSYKRLIYLEFIDAIVSYVSKKLFLSNFIDSYYMLSKDKWVNVIIKLCQITPKIFKKVSYDDARNKERIINIIKGMKDSEKYTGTTMEIIDSTYMRLLNLRIISSDEK